MAVSSLRRKSLPESPHKSGMSIKRDEKEANNDLKMHLPLNKTAYCRMEPQPPERLIQQAKLYFKGMLFVKRQRIIKETISVSNQNSIIMFSLPHKIHTCFLHMNK